MRGRAARAGLLAAAALALAGCAGLRPVGARPGTGAPGPAAAPERADVAGGTDLGPGPPPEGTPGERAGWLAYRVGRLRFEAPAGWTRSGDPGRLVLEAGRAARLEAWVVDARYASARACLDEAEASLERGEGQLARVRRHPTTLGGRPALVQEADAGGWHGWAYAACAGPVQHRLFFTGRSPIPAELLEAWREVVKSARVGGGA